MGIRGLARSVQECGAFSPLSGDSVVIDGPALVHRITDACMAQRLPGSGLVGHPPYSLLSHLVIGWLEDLKNHDVNVRKIYFDGYLPPSKWEVRRKRVGEQSQTMRRIMKLQPRGSLATPENTFNLPADLNLTKNDVTMIPRIELPKPPFTIPAVLEALVQSTDWGPLISVVPGEADMFCAQDIRENGGTLLTNDSDLLLQDLGPNGCVAFLWNIRPAVTSTEELVAWKTTVQDINKRLRLTEVGGLPRVAFMQQDRGVNFNQALGRLRKYNEVTENSFKYEAFMEELQFKEYIPRDHPVFGVLSGLDPRVSEVIVLAHLLEKKGVHFPKKAKRAMRGPETLSIFLPVIVENPDKKSAWTMSTNVRQIAYSVLRLLMRRESNAIIEYRTLDPGALAAGRRIEIPSLEETVGDCVQLTAVLKKLAKGMPSPGLRWLAFALYQDIDMSTSEQRPPLSVTLIQEAVKYPNDSQLHSWDLIHFTAQIQACLYSLRINKQILGAVLFVKGSLPVEAQQLLDHLTSLLPIAEWPTIEEVPGLLSRFAKLNGLAMINDMLGIEPEERRRQEDKPDQKDNPLFNKVRRTYPGKHSSLNRFDILSQD
ncbi:XPG domain containing-domain-containing protein [Hypoxylon sp. NC1633]|nr:XPG domain containing-domain-containing protein [Hypoxylon sp. NC1633]